MGSNAKTAKLEKNIYAVKEMICRERHYTVQEYIWTEIDFLYYVS